MTSLPRFAQSTGRPRFLTTYHRPVTTLLLTLVIVLAALSGTASAFTPIAWRLQTVGTTTAAPGGQLSELVDVRNVGSEAPPASSVPYTFTASFPTALTVSSVSGGGSNTECMIAPDGHTITCTLGETDFRPLVPTSFYIQLEVSPSAEEGETLVSHFAFSDSDPETPEGAAAHATRVAALPPSFGIDAFDVTNTSDTGLNSFTQAGGHPYAQTTSIDFNSEANPNPLKGFAWPVQPTKDIVTELPPGLVGDVASLPRCRFDQLAVGEGISGTPECSADSQVGTVMIRTVRGIFLHPVVNGSWGPIAVYNMEPSPGSAATFAFAVVGTVVTVNFTVRTGGDYGLTASLDDIPEGLDLVGSDFTVWGVPGSPAHDAERHCPGTREPLSEAAHCAASNGRVILRMPTSCAGPGHGLATAIYSDSWFEPGSLDENGEPVPADSRWQASTSVSHQSPGYPWTRGEWGPEATTEGCGRVRFRPGFTAQPTTNVADAPTGLDLHLTVPQECWDEEAENYEPICQSDLRDGAVKLPAGMTINPSAAAGLEACTPAQIGLASEPGETPIVFNQRPAKCPEASKIGDVTIATPLLDEELTGAVYLAKQYDNPYHSLLAMYLVADAPERGVLVKQAAEIAPDPSTGRLITTVSDAPQSPFNELHVSLFGGPRAALRTPPSCGTFAVSAKLTPWSGTGPATLADAFEIEKCPNSGFHPKLVAGTQNPLAGATSPFSLRLTREDGEQEMGDLSATLPPGLSGYLTGIPYCPDSVLTSISEEEGTGAAQEASPSCPAASLVGRVTVGAGAGSEPFYTQSGRAYLAGPYKGAPLSLAVVAPAVAGPFDLGSVVVRDALRIDPETAQITAVSDAIPHILHGIPLDLRDVRVELNREHFTLNPTSCDEMQIASTISSTSGASASPSQRFQVAGCDRLGFKPRLALQLKGKHNRGAHPALHAVLTMPPSNQANVARAAVTLPGTELLEQGHIRTTCTRVQYAAGGGGGEQCPAGSVYGYAKAWTPLLDKPLEGPVYLRSNGGERELPDLVASLGGQIHIDLIGYIDSVHARIRNTFATVPDAPVTKFVLDMQGGSKSLLVNSTNLCKARPHATALFDAHNGKIHDVAPLVTAGCGKKKGGHRRR